MQMWVVRFILLAVSMYGYLLFFSRKMRAEFAVGFLLSGIGSAVFIGGILHFLPGTALLVFLGGFACLGLSLYKRHPIRETITLGTVFFLALCAFFLYLLPGSKFTSWDNFSHWALAAKSLLQNDRLPSAHDQVVILYQSYPLGTASFIYYICKVTGNTSEWMQMFAQAMLLSGMVVCLFPLAEGLLLKLATVLIAIMLLCSNMPFFELLVDSLLPLVALSALAYCAYYRDEMDAKAYYVIPWLLFLIGIKNSGVLFVLIILAYLVLRLSPRRHPAKACVVILSPFALLALWMIHVKRAFPDGTTGRHAMFLNNILSGFHEKSWRNILRITYRFAKSMLSGSSRLWFIALFAFLLLFLTIRIVRDRAALELAILGILSYVVHQICLLMVYLTTMSVGEGLLLSGLDRYCQTIHAFVAGVFLLSVYLSIPRLEFMRRWRWTAVIAGGLCVAMVHFLVLPRMSFYQKQRYAGCDRDRFEQMLERYHVDSNKSYLLLVEETNGSNVFAYYLIRYQLYPKSATYVFLNEVEGTDLNAFDYIITLNNSDAVKAYLQTAFNTEDPIIDLSRFRQSQDMP